MQPITHLEHDKAHEIIWQQNPTFATIAPCYSLTKLMPLLKHIDWSFHFYQTYGIGELGDYYVIKAQGIHILFHQQRGIVDICVNCHTHVSRHFQCLYYHYGF